MNSLLHIHILILPLLVRDTYCSYSVVDLCMRELGNSIESLQVSLYINIHYYSLMFIPFLFLSFSLLHFLSLEQEY